ncbi:MAG: aquaporin [Candidatus Eisenbacteria bacterium]|nr:aquaporin [Candidatus Eisenbacteria bacterium]
MREYLTETIGTFFLVLTVCLSVLGNQPLAPLAIGASLMVMVYMGGHISGGHYNPAVSLAVALRGKLPMKQLLPYWFFQMVGAVLAALVSRVVMNQTMHFFPSPSATISESLLVEFLFTFALCLVVLQTATSAKTQGNSYYGLAIGFTVTFGAVAGGGISGGAFNPAVALGPILVDATLARGPFHLAWIYLVGPLLGGVVAAWAFKSQGNE